MVVKELIAEEEGEDDQGDDDEDKEDNFQPKPEPLDNNDIQEAKSE